MGFWVKQEVFMMKGKWIWKIKTELTEVELDKREVLWEDDKYYFLRDACDDGILRGIKKNECLDEKGIINAIEEFLRKFEGIKDKSFDKALVTDSDDLEWMEKEFEKVIRKIKIYRLEKQIKLNMWDIDIEEKTIETVLKNIEEYKREILEKKQKIKELREIE